MCTIEFVRGIGKGGASGKRDKVHYVANGKGMLYSIEAVESYLMKKVRAPSPLPSSSCMPPSPRGRSGRSPSAFSALSREPLRAVQGAPPPLCTALFPSSLRQGHLMIEGARVGGQGGQGRRSCLFSFTRLPQGQTPACLTLLAAGQGRADRGAWGSIALLLCPLRQGLVPPLLIPAAAHKLSTPLPPTPS